MLSGNEIRRKFLDYFVQRGHKEVHSSSLVPANDPTLLFTNAGMNQFKDVFLGLEKRDYNRATTSQKCVRAGGKHNDLENVGFTNRHHTFFEMLGNFSLGDYFKREAIAYAWELITSPEWYAIPKDKLYATIFKGEGVVPRDEEAYNFWLEQGVPKERIYEFGLKDNFWQMGDTGPCGPCSEIHYDMGPAASDQGHGVSAPECKFGCECGRYIEIWNLVFMQFDRTASQTVDVKTGQTTYSNFKLNPLPKPSIDTGMGLERITAVLQGVMSNYDTDLFVPLIKRAAELCGVDAEKELKAEAGGRNAASLRVIADHARATTFLISDGVLPLNEGRGYVLRKIMRRAIRHGRLLGQNKPFLYQMVHAVCEQMCGAYPELVDSAERLAKVVEGEESRFAQTLNMGNQYLQQQIERPRMDAKSRLLDELDEEKPQHASQIMNAFKNAINANNIELLFRDVERFFGRERAQLFARDWQATEEVPLRLSGREAFDIFQTYGLPKDFIEDVCRDTGIKFDDAGFEEARKEEQVRARASWKGVAKGTAQPDHLKFPSTRLEGYTELRTEGALVLGIFKPGAPLTRSLEPGEEGEVILDRTPFYADSGGQVGDTGWLYSTDDTGILADVTGCIMPVQGVRFHKVQARHHIEVSDLVNAVVERDMRLATMRNHTATHLLHAGLREKLGPEVKQAGSLVDPEHLRFDFNYLARIEDKDLQDIEDLINKEVLRNTRVQEINDVPFDEAKTKYKAIALFGEKYGDRVRVIKIGDFSTELCGGTHTEATGEIGQIKILEEGSVSSGVRRIEAVTGLGSLRHFRKDHALERAFRKIVHLEEESVQAIAELPARLVSGRDEEIKRLRKELEQARMKSASATTASIEDKVRVVNGVKVLAHRVDNLERAQLRTLVDNLRQKLGSGVVVVGSAADGTVSLVAGVTKDLTARVQAGKVIGPVAEKVGGKGGGRPDLAEAGGKDPAALDEALGSVYAVVESLLK